jgi:uncharacterized protein
MKVVIEKTFPMPARIDVVWSLLQGIEGVARCMPGAKITERIDDTHFKGTVSVKVGPASMAFKGDIEVKELDAARHVLRLLGKGSDSSGTSGASMDLTARVEAGETPETSNLIGTSEVTMSGKAAAFGGRMMGSVADQILKQFAGNFAKQVSEAAGRAGATNVTAAATAEGANTVPGTTDAAGAPSPAGTTNAAGAPSPAGTTNLAGATTEAAAATATTVAPGPAISAPATNPTSPSATAATLGLPHSAPSPVATPVVAPVVASAAMSSAVDPAALTSAFAPPAPTGLSAPITAAETAGEPANEINALALLWAIIRDWFRGLFRRKPA